MTSDDDGAALHELARRFMYSEISAAEYLRGDGLISAASVALG